MCEEKEAWSGMLFRFIVVCPEKCTIFKGPPFYQEKESNQITDCFIFLERFIDLLHLAEENKSSPVVGVIVSVTGLHRLLLFESRIAKGLRPVHFA
jgi:hypothetical protein